ncbi:hypothetical protein [Endozoicomonas sp. 8E]|uniref:hypothetical protein n=1 Tax=Endozoicomonas sp. 8E TaxID=3035692 RepID=UPI0029392236|nr:hypothetical protein [Endozoicomonas sp. 8E]WOG26997.1 hypothetical protein P6910_20965 [Endozoicomonas sp. 8E]
MLSVMGQAEPLTRLYIVELQQDAGSPNQSFSIKPDWHRLAGNPSDITDTKSSSGSDCPPYDKRRRPVGYGVKATLIGSIFWQWLYAINLLVAYELILTTKDTPLNPTPYSWLPIEKAIAVGWLLKSYWTPYSPLFKAIDRQKVSMLTRGGHPFAVTTMVPGYGDDQQQGQPSGSSDQQALETPNSPASYFISFQYYDSGDGDEAPQQHQHTLGLNCFVYPCHGVCRFRSESNSSETAEWPLNSEESRTGQTAATAGQNSRSHLTEGPRLSYTSDFDALNASDSRQSPPLEILNSPSYVEFQCVSDQPFQAYQSEDAQMYRNESVTADDLTIVDGLLSLRNHGPLKEREISFTPAHSPTPMETLETQQTTRSFQWVQSPPHISQTGTSQTTDQMKSTCDLSVVQENGPQQPCGKFFRNTHALKLHKSRVHSGRRTCDVTVIGDDDTGRPCGKNFKNILALRVHKCRYHSGQKTCYMTVVVEGRKERPCKKVFNNAQAMLDHQQRDHTGYQSCDTRVLGKDGQRQPCGKVCLNARALTDHKRRYHSGQKTCDIKVIGEDNQQRPCGKVFKNTPSLSFHKKRYHSEKKTCDIELVGEDNQQRPCGRVLKSAYAQ